MSAVQLKKFLRKGHRLYAIKFNKIGMEKPETTIEELPILKEF